MSRKSLIVFSALLLLSAARLGAQNGGERPDYPRALAFFHRLQDALRKNDRAEISELIELSSADKSAQEKAFDQNTEGTSR